MRRLLLWFLVFNMRWMTRYLSFIALPFIRWYADQEVIACGLRSPDGRVHIIYTPVSNKKEYVVLKKKKVAGKTKKTNWVEILTAQSKNFSGIVVQSVELPEAKIGDVYRMKATRRKSGRVVYSPAITIKEETLVHTDIIETIYLENGSVRSSWKSAKIYPVLIYFLVIEDAQGDLLSAVYTREYKWTYPLIKKASLSIGPKIPPLLQPEKRYTQRLIVVDYDGWVSALCENTFTYYNKG